MRVSQAKELFRSLLQEYFAGAEVSFSRQSRAAKGSVPLVIITPGNVHRTRDSVMDLIDGTIVASYPSRISMQVDLFTKGAPVTDPSTGKIIASENTAMDDILAFMDFLDSLYVIAWCNKHDVSMVIDGDAQDLTGIVNDNNYEYRSRVSVFFYFTQTAVGHTATLDENSIKVPENAGTEGEDRWDDATIVPDFTPTSTGGGSEELASEETGYFTEVEIKEEKVNE